MKRCRYCWAPLDAGRNAYCCDEHRFAALKTRNRERMRRARLHSMRIAAKGWMRLW